MLTPKRKPQRKKNMHKRGKGDSVKEIAEYWGDATVDEIYDRVVKWKAKKRQKSNAAGKG